MLGMRQSICGLFVEQVQNDLTMKSGHSTVCKNLEGSTAFDVDSGSNLITIRLVGTRNLIAAHLSL